MEGFAPIAPLSPEVQTPRVLGRYEILGTLGRGGMATVYLGRSAGEAGFQRLFAIKVLHPHLADDADFVSMLLDEARIAARLHHPNVVPIVDLGTQGTTHYVVMEYVEGCSLWALLRKYRDKRPPRLIIPIVLDALAGLHAAHTLTDDDGAPLNLVHRDVSPQNVLVGVDGTARITDFGIARAESRINTTRPGQVKGKIAYMSPEQIRGGSEIDSRSDVFSAGGMLWCALTGHKLFLDTSDAATMTNILQMPVPPPSGVGLKPPAAFDAICARALEREPAGRYATAQEMEDALREAATSNNLLGARREVAEWVKAAFSDELSARRKAIRSFQGAPRSQREPETTGPSVSGFRPVDLPSITPPSADMSGPLPSDTGSSFQPKRKRTMMIAGGAVAGVGLLVALVFALTRPHEQPSASMPSAVPPPPMMAMPTPPKVDPVSSAHEALATTTPPAIVTTATPKATAVWHAAAAPVAVKKIETPPPATTTTAANKPWDKDSPLPPP